MIEQAAHCIRFNEYVFGLRKIDFRMRGLRNEIMNLIELKKALAEHPAKTIRFVLPTGSAAPPHAHVTEVAQIDKRFIDCGGTFRTDSVCRLQTWFADDTDHRLSAGKLLSILAKSGDFIKDGSIEVEVEHEAPFISQFPITSLEVDGDLLVVQLGIKHTDCLAKDRCLPPKLAVNPFAPLPSFKEAACCGGAC